MLELLDMRRVENKADVRAKDGELTQNLRAEDAAQIIKEFFEQTA